MPRLIYLDPTVLTLIVPDLRSEPDPVVIETVHRALAKLDPHLRELIRRRFTEGMTFREIATDSGMSEEEAVASIREAKAQLRIMLADFVHSRWGIPLPRNCRVCNHPMRQTIEMMLKERNRRESWGCFCRRLSGMIGERFHPPQILISHERHMTGHRNLEGRKNEGR